MEAINAYGIKINHRTYDSPELHPLRRQRSGIAEKKGLWEIHHDPYDVSRIWVRDRRGDSDRWITVFWRHLHRVGVPFGEMAWAHARQQAPARPSPLPSWDALTNSSAGPGTHTSPTVSRSSTSPSRPPRPPA